MSEPVARTRAPAALRGLRVAWVVARFDLGESLRSRKVLIFLALYAAGSVAAAVIFTEVLQEVRDLLTGQDRVIDGAGEAAKAGAR